MKLINFFFEQNFLLVILSMKIAAAVEVRTVCRLTKVEVKSDCYCPDSERTQKPPNPRYQIWN